MPWSKTGAVVAAVTLSGVLAFAMRGTGVADEDSNAACAAPASTTVNHVLSTGQSLSLGLGGAPPLTTAQPYANLMLEPGVINGGAGSARFVPLVEGDALPGSTVALETMSSAFANLVTTMAREQLVPARPQRQCGHDVLVSVHGLSGMPYSVLKKGTTAYENGMAQARKARELAIASGRAYVVRAVTSVHGEADHTSSNGAYEANLLEWQRDYETDARALTGQAEPVPMFITQMSSWTVYGAATSAIPAAQLGAHVAAPGKVILVGPKYHLPYVDGVHLTNEGYRHMGEDHAKAYRRVVLEGRTWEPVRPKKITRASAVITVVFHVPSPPLVLDAALVSNPGGFGFSYIDDSAAPPVIRRVAVSAPDTLRITLSAPPQGSNGRLRYAFSGNAGARGGPKTGPRGNLRDSDATHSRSGHALYNWCVHFDEPVP
jgi:hypothetical protein